MPNLLVELQRQRDATLTQLTQMQLAADNLAARLASIDKVLADMMRDDTTAMTYGTLVIDATGVTVIAGTDVQAADVQIAVVPKPLVL